MKTSISKSLIFAILSGIGAFLGSLLGYPIAATASGFTEILVRTGVWTALLAVGMGIAFVLAQSWYLKQIQSGARDIAKIAGVCAIAGFMGGAALIVLRRWLSDAPDISSLTIAWGVEGLIIGVLIAHVIPNLPRLPALAAGGIAGVLGAITMVGLNTIGLGGATSVAIGDSLKGIFLGFLLILTEKLVREAWLEVHYASNEVRNISLGKTPVSIGSDTNLATVYVRHIAPLVLRYHLSQGQILCEDVPAQSTRRVFDGDRQTLGKLEVIVRTAAQSQRKISPLACVDQPQVSLSLYIKRQVFRLQRGQQFQPHDIPGLEPQGTDRVVAEVSSHPHDATLLGLKNTSYQSWSVTLATGEWKRIDPGRTITLTPGARIVFGLVAGEIKP